MNAEGGNTGEEKKTGLGKKSETATGREWPTEGGKGSERKEVTKA